MNFAWWSLHPCLILLEKEPLDLFSVIVNMVWDLHAKVKGKLLWRLIGSIWPKDCLIVQMHSECSN